MKNDKVHFFLCNHWTEGGIGYAFPSGWYNNKKYDKGFSSVYTVEKMLDAADEYPHIIASMELDTYTYDVLEEVAPETLKRLKDYIDSGKASVEGGTYGQPLGQDYGWEFNIRQLTLGRETIRRHFDYEIHALLLEEQWFHPQLPQLLKNSGFKYASLQNQNSGQVMPMNKAMINWVGIDGTQVPTIPANNIMVSCVRQYTDYEHYKDILYKYDYPLLFQWVEIWSPGMDWGSSIAPFEKALKQIEEWNGKPVSLQGYFEETMNKFDLEDIYIPLDQSNYKNDWYQEGGWGYNGDKIMINNRQAEKSIMNYENSSLFYPVDTEYYKNLEDMWKDMMVLQNHDVSVARGYRAFDENGIETTADSYVNKKLIGIKSENDKKWGSILNLDGLDESVFYYNNYTGFICSKEVKVEVKGLLDNECLTIMKGDKEILNGLSYLDGKTYLSFYDDFEGIDNKEYKVIKKRKQKVNDTDYQKSSPIKVDKGDIKVVWNPGDWDISITNTKTDVEIKYQAFSGNIGKMNEHALLYPALSSAHKIFVFAFDGTTHCPDQCSGMYIKGRIIDDSDYQTVLELYCPLLTLHTMDLPVAYCKSTVTINHLSGDIKCGSYLYTSVPLNVSAFSKFNHNIANASYTRDFPFGEEVSEIDNIYANSYIRVKKDNEKEKAFTILNNGIQKIDLKRFSDRGEIACKTSKSKLLFEYNWDYTIRFGTDTGIDSIKMFKEQEAGFISDVAPSSNMLNYKMESDSIIVSTHYAKEHNGEKRYYIRFVNYSDSTTKDKIIFSIPIRNAFYCDFEENILEDINNEKSIDLIFKPWEIKTISFTC